MMGLFFSFFFFSPPLYLVLRNPHPSVRPKPGRLFCFFELSLCYEAISTVILEVCNPLHQRGCHGLLLSLCCSASTIPGLQARSNCSCVLVISQQIQPSFQPKELFLGAFSLQALRGQSVLGCSAYEMPRAHFPLVEALLLPHLVKPCVICRKHHGIVG